MAKFRVRGMVEVYVEVDVEIDEEELGGMDSQDIEDLILERAYDEFEGIKEYAGNGGYDKIIGVGGVDERIEVGGEVEFDYIERLT